MVEKKTRIGHVWIRYTVKKGKKYEWVLVFYGKQRIQGEMSSCAIFVFAPFLRQSFFPRFFFTSLSRIFPTEPRKSFHFDTHCRTCYRSLLGHPERGERLHETLLPTIISQDDQQISSLNICPYDFYPRQSQYLLRSSSCLWLLMNFENIKRKTWKKAKNSQCSILFLREKIVINYISIFYGLKRRILQSPNLERWTLRSETKNEEIAPLFSGNLLIRMRIGFIGKKKKFG